MFGLSQGIGGVPAETCGDLSLEESELQQLSRRSAQGTVQRAYAATARRRFSGRMRSMPHHEVVEGSLGFRPRENEIPIAGGASRNGLH